MIRKRTIVRYGTATGKETNTKVSHEREAEKIHEKIKKKDWESKKKIKIPK